MNNNEDFGTQYSLALLPDPYSFRPFLPSPSRLFLIVFLCLSLRPPQPYLKLTLVHSGLCVLGGVVGGALMFAIWRFVHLTSICLVFIGLVS